MDPVDVVRPPAGAAPGPAVDLAGALRAYVDSFERDTGIRSYLRFGPGGRLDGTRATLLNQVVQAVLANVAKHAGARHVWIGFDEAAGATELDIRHDGAGLDPAARGGPADQGHDELTWAREQVELAGGLFRVNSHQARGSIIMVSLPPPSDRRRPAVATPPPTGKAPAGST
jgi:signal transduction histidine kinase